MKQGDKGFEAIHAIMSLMFVQNLGARHESYGIALFLDFKKALINTQQVKYAKDSNHYGRYRPRWRLSLQAFVGTGLPCNWSYPQLQ
jgi:hypothetical protein